MDEMFAKINGHLQDLDASYRQVTREIDQMKNSLDMIRASVTTAQAATAALGGTFSSIEVHMKRQAADQAAVVARLDTAEARLKELDQLVAIKQRLDALEQRMPPAA